jgi:hypothetical protein
VPTGTKSSNHQTIGPKVTSSSNPRAVEPEKSLSRGNHASAEWEKLLREVTVKWCYAVRETKGRGPERIRRLADELNRAIKPKGYRYFEK